MMKINKKIKAFMSIIMACFMCVGVLLSIKADVYADSSKEYVYDNAGILTSDEVSKLKSQCKKASEDSECDIVIITTNIGHDGSTMDSYLKKFLDDNGVKHYEIYGPLFFGSTTAFLEKFDPVGDPLKVVVDFKESKVVDMSAIDALNKLSQRYSKQGKTVHLRHLSPDCRKLLSNADAVIDIHILEDPSYVVMK